MVITVDDGVRSDVVMSSAASATSAENGDFSELVSGGDNESNWFPTIAMDGDGNLHVVWYELDVSNGFKASILYRMKSVDTWGPIETVAEDIGFMMFINPSLSLDTSGNVHVVWESNRNISDSGTDRDIFYKVRTQGEWTATELVSAESNRPSSMPSIAVDRDDNVHISWTDASDIFGPDKNTSVLYRMNADFGWTSTRVIQNDADSICKNSKLIVIDNGDVHISWIEIVGDDYVHHIKHRMKQGGLWSDVGTVHRSAVDIDAFNEIRMVSDSNGRLHLAWSEHDYMNEHGTDENDVTWNYHTVLDDGVWSTPQTIPVGIYDTEPVLAIDGDDRLHVIVSGVPSDYDPEIQRTADTINIGYITYHEGVWSEYGFVDLDREGSKMMTSMIVDGDRNVHTLWMDIPSGGGMFSDVRYAMVDNSGMFIPSPDGETSVGVFILFVGGLLAVSLLVVRMRG